MAIRPLRAARELQTPSTGSAAAADRHDVAVGAEIRALRKANGLTLEILICTIESGADSDDYRHDGDETGVVIEGTLDLWVDGTHHRLEARDSFAFSSTRTHRCANGTDTVTKVLWIITPPHY